MIYLSVTNTRANDVIELGSNDPNNPQKLLIKENGIIGKAGQKLLIKGYVEISHFEENIYTEEAKKIYIKFDSIQFTNNGLVYTKSDLGIYPTKYLGGFVRIHSVRGQNGVDGKGYSIQSSPITQKAPNGANGSNGRDASCGVRNFVPYSRGAKSGSNGGAGSEGYRGNDGQHGEQGENATHSSNILIELNKISLDSNLRIEVVAEGGNGGQGGNGQKGGIGGEGGNGGKGGNGGDGSECGRSAKNGGNGGNAGNGGNGGDGGDGGNGGKGGNGGLIEVYFSDVNIQDFLFQGIDKRVVAKYKGGNGGKPGLGGEGGEGGKPGARGCGGSKGKAEGIPNIWQENGDNGDCGNTGTAGNVGKRGLNGKWGDSGQDGTLRHSNYKYVEERSTDFFNMPNRTQGRYIIL
ncbi:hypothetical protein ACFSTE_14685 [Aquimarina hainanensis]|uniref:Collagen-like protein n=1 Tax=Aquimarina hainanensis TaxID=1578017 RepID=A0ABW5NBW1_9FLAO